MSLLVLCEVLILFGLNNEITNINHNHVCHNLCYKNLKKGTIKAVGAAKRKICNVLWIQCELSAMFIPIPRFMETLISTLHDQIMSYMFSE